MHCSTEQSPRASTTVGARVDAGGARKFGGLGGPAEGLHRAHAAPDQLADHLADQGVRQVVGVPRLTPIDVSSTASALTGPVGKRWARGTARGGA